MCALGMVISPEGGRTAEPRVVWEVTGLPVHCQTHSPRRRSCDKKAHRPQEGAYSRSRASVLNVREERGLRRPAAPAGVDVTLGYTALAPSAFPARGWLRGPAWKPDRVGPPAESPWAGRTPAVLAEPSRPMCLAPGSG